MDRQEARKHFNDSMQNYPEFDTGWSHVENDEIISDPPKKLEEIPEEVIERVIDAYLMLNEAKFIDFATAECAPGAMEWLGEEDIVYIWTDEEVGEVMTYCIDDWFKHTLENYLHAYFEPHPYNWPVAHHYEVSDKQVLENLKYFVSFYTKAPDL